MENNNTYDDLILELLQEHRKYSQVADYTDAIVEDVHKRADSILESIENNPETIKGYLRKVVSVSIITFSQQMKNKIKESANYNEPVKTISEEDDIVEKEQNKTIDTNITPETDDSITSNSVSEEILPTEYETVSDSSLDEFVSALEDTNTENPQIDEMKPTELIQEAISDFDENTIDLTAAEEQNFNKDTVTNDAEICDSLAETTDDEFLLPDDTNETVIDIVDTDRTVTELADDMINGVHDEDDTQKQEIQNDILNSSIDNDEEDIIADSERDVTFLDTDNTSEFLLSQTDETVLTSELDEQDLMFNDSEADSILCSDTEDDAVEMLPEAEDYPLEEAVNDSTFDDNCEIKIDIDKDEIQAELCKLDNDYTDLHILNVFDLKYKKNATISEISEMLSISEDNVTEALCKIISIIED